MSEVYEMVYFFHNWKTTWITKDGDCIDYKDMSDSHLLNTHRMINNKCVLFVNKCIAENIERDLPQQLKDIIEGLENELNKRGLLK